tara:strand:- start:602 stop:994 length:393 start_codon:yes stop_codon:yes gene_type:complete
MLKNKIRIDKFLWCIRFYKSRTLSKAACNKSKIKINSKNAKSSSSVSRGDIVSIKKKALLITIKIIKILDKRISAKLIDNYIEDLTPKSEKIKLEARKKLLISHREKGQGRPTKKERRDMDKSLGDYSKL